MLNFKCLLIVLTFLFLVSCDEKKYSSSSVNTKPLSNNNDSLRQIIEILEGENKSIVIENNNLKSELSIHEAQNEYIKKITVEYNSIQNSLSDLLQKQISIINNTNDVEANRNPFELNTATKLKQYIDLMENSYKNSRSQLLIIEQQLDEEKKRIINLNTELESKGNIIKEFESMVENLNLEIKKRDELVSVLQDKINNLNSVVVSLTTELNTAYYLVGSEDYLIEKNILTKKGGVNLGLFSFGEVLTTLPGYNLSVLFNKLDVRQIDEIKLLKYNEYQILPERPLNSYRIYYNSRYNSFCLKIINRNLFWKDRFIIIAYDE